jgi:hypothetical protein
MTPPFAYTSPRVVAFDIGNLWRLVLVSEVNCERNEGTSKHVGVILAESWSSSWRWRQRGRLRER